MNIQINLGSIADEAFVAKAKKQIAESQAAAASYIQAVQSAVTKPSSISRP
jgi:formiminotetrahydrofolate cyclodeaminase